MRLLVDFGRLPALEVHATQVPALLVVRLLLPCALVPGPRIEVELLIELLRVRLRHFQPGPARVDAGLGERTFVAAIVEEVPLDDLEGGRLVRVLLGHRALDPHRPRVHHKTALGQLLGRFPPVMVALGGTDDGALVLLLGLLLFLRETLHLAPHLQRLAAREQCKLLPLRSQRDLLPPLGLEERVDLPAVHQAHLVEAVHREHLVLERARARGVVGAGRVIRVRILEREVLLRKLHVAVHEHLLLPLRRSVMLLGSRSRGRSRGRSRSVRLLLLRTPIIVYFVRIGLVEGRLVVDDAPEGQHLDRLASRGRADGHGGDEQANHSQPSDTC
mmetsp:Transcript_24075/g.57386  ORF Transcript_24075/g.57386 Transcript_24075/m.57386 type:complete len:331 (+) Transcript_24075:326-1318(+)